MNLNIKELIEKIVHKKGPGPSTTFSMFHIYYAIELISKKTIGRNRIAKEIEVGEGAIRTIIDHLKEENLIITSRQGCNLTEKGMCLWEKIEQMFPKRIKVKRTELNNSKYNFAFLIKNSGHKIKSGIIQRDAAIMGGADRATVIVSKKGKLAIKSVSRDIEKDFPEASKKILKDLSPKNNDVIIVAGADSAIRAKRGAFAASWILIN